MMALCPVPVLANDFNGAMALHLAANAGKYILVACHWRTGMSSISGTDPKIPMAYPLPALEEQVLRTVCQLLHAYPTQQDGRISIT